MVFNMATSASTLLRARIDLKPLLTHAERLFPAYRQHLYQQCDLFDPEDGTQPDAKRYDDTAEDLNDTLPLCSELVPSEWEEAVARAERENDSQAAEWRRKTPVHALFDLSPRIGGKAAGVVQEAVAWGRSTSTDPSTEAQLDYLNFLARSKPLTIFENLTYAAPTSRSAELRLDKLQEFTITALSRYVVHLDEVRPVDIATTEAEQDAVNEASDELSAARALQTVLDPNLLAGYEGEPLSAEHLWKARQNLLHLNEQASGKARHVVKSLRMFAGTQAGANASDGSDGEATSLDLLDFLASGLPGSRACLFSLL